MEEKLNALEKENEVTELKIIVNKRNIFIKLLKAEIKKMKNSMDAMIQQRISEVMNEMSIQAGIKVALELEARNIME